MKRPGREGLCYAEHFRRYRGVTQEEIVAYIKRGDTEAAQDALRFASLHLRPGGRWRREGVEDPLADWLADALLAATVEDPKRALGLARPRGKQPYGSEHLNRDRAVARRVEALIERGQSKSEAVAWIADDDARRKWMAEHPEDLPDEPDPLTWDLMADGSDTRQRAIWDALERVDRLKSD